MRKLIAKIMNIIYTKYILGQCRHSCLLCKFRNECFDNLDIAYDEYERGK